MRTYLAAISARAALAVLALPASAHAEEPTMAPDAHPISLHTSGGLTASSANGSSVTKADANVGLSYDPTHRLSIRVSLGDNVLRLKYAGSMDDGLSVNTTLWSYVGLSASTAASYRLYDGSRLRLEGYGEFETSLFQSTPSIKSLLITTSQGTFDVTPYGRDNLDSKIYWNQIALGTRARFFAGRFEPNIGFSLQRIDAALDLQVSQDGRKTITRLGYDPLRVELRHTLTFWSLPITTGLDVRLHEKNWVGVAGTVAPAGDSWLLGGTLLYRHAF